MSTRCQIEFIVDESRRTIYRHSDGYPESVIPDLEVFLKWNLSRNNDIEYMAANFIYWSKKQGSELTGFGICNNDELHGDIEYFYKVKVVTAHQVKIEVYKVNEMFDRPETLDIMALIEIKEIGL